MKKFRAALPALALAAAFAALLRFPQEVSAAVTEGLRLSVSVLIPSLFPFFICVNLTSALGLTGVLARVFAPVMRQMFHVSGAGCTAVLCGAAGGDPSVAKGSSRGRKRNIYCCSATTPGRRFCSARWVRCWGLG